MNLLANGCISIKSAAQITNIRNTRNSHIYFLHWKLKISSALATSLFRTFSKPFHRLTNIKFNFVFFSILDFRSFQLQQPFCRFRFLCYEIKSVANKNGNVSDFIRRLDQGWNSEKWQPLLAKCNTDGTKNIMKRL